MVVIEGQRAKAFAGNLTLRTGDTPKTSWAMAFFEEAMKLHAFPPVEACDDVLAG